MAHKPSGKMRELSREPVSAVQWVHRKKLKPNHYNPNRVAPPELEGLVLSILEDGWTQPIVVRPDYTIVDGFHRYLVSDDPRLKALYKGMVPVVMLNVCDVHAMMSTIRHNRMRGTHAVLKMADIAQAFIENGVPKEEIMRRLQMEDEEVERLLERAGTPDRVGRTVSEFGKAWVPR